MPTVQVVSCELLNARKLNVREAAGRVGISESSLRRLIWRGQLAALTVGGKVVVLERDLEDLLQRSYGRVQVKQREHRRRERSEVLKSPHLDV